MKMEQLGASDRTPITFNNTKELDLGLSDFKYFQDQMRPKSTSLKLPFIDFVDNTNKESSTVAQSVRTPAPGAKSGESNTSSNSIENRVNEIPKKLPIIFEKSTPGQGTTNPARPRTPDSPSENIAPQPPAPATPTPRRSNLDNSQLPTSRPLNPSISPLESPRLTPFSRPLNPLTPGGPLPERNPLQPRQPEGLPPIEERITPVRPSKEPDRSAPAADQTRSNNVPDENSSDRSTTNGAVSTEIALDTTNKTLNELDAADSEPFAKKGFRDHVNEQYKKILSTVDQAVTDYLELGRKEQNRLLEDFTKRFGPEVADQLIKLGCKEVKIDGNSVNMEFYGDQNIPINQNRLRSVMIERNVKFDFAKNGNDIDIKNINGVRLDFSFSILNLKVPDITLTPNGTAKTSFGTLPFPPEMFNRVKTAMESLNK